MLQNQVVTLEIDYDKLVETILFHMDRVEQDSSKKNLFYSMEDLVALTSFSKGHIINTFFSDPRFKLIRRKVGRKWVFPVRDTEEFLSVWIQEQPHE